MGLTEFNGLQVNSVLNQIIELSSKLSTYSPPMKPFIRFARQADLVYKQGCASKKSLFWDFDYSLQKVLLGLVHEVASPAQLADLCLAQWNTNLERLRIRKWNELQALKDSGKAYQFNYTPRDEFILSRIKPGSRFLYLGCGSGTECLKLANRGHCVIGIDAVPGLIDVANEWAEHLSLPFEAICMDARALDLEEESFDGFLVEFYGEQPSLSQALLLQRNLAKILREGGKGFVVATRKKYSSFWFRMAPKYSKEMTSWLRGQAFLDQHFSEPDNFEEQLMYGLFWRCHTTKSLAAELSNNFKILECDYEKYDPRYVMCVVGRKNATDSSRHFDMCNALVEPEAPCLDLSTTSLKEVLYRIALICDIMEAHDRSVSQFFDHVRPTSGKNPLQEVETDLSRFIELLEEVLYVLPS